MTAEGNKHIANELFHKWAYECPDYEPLDEDLILSLIDRITAALEAKDRKLKEPSEEEIRDAGQQHFLNCDDQMVVSKKSFIKGVHWAISYYRNSLGGK